jgi:hypothetical protein
MRMLRTHCTVLLLARLHNSQLNAVPFVLNYGKRPIPHYTWLIFPAHRFTPAQLGLVGCS